MAFDNIILEIVIVFAGASLLSTVFVFLKQPILLAYIVLGMLIGPWGFKLVDEPAKIQHLSHLGIILLLFLLGLELHPEKLVKLFRKTTLITIATSIVFVSVVMGICLAFGFDTFNSLIIGAALMFSSTVVSLKLLSNVALHHRYIGDLMISVLLLQDIIAIILILLLTGQSTSNYGLMVSLLFLKVILLSGVSFLFVKYIFLYLYNRFKSIQEYVFLISLGWCLLVTESAKSLGLSYEIGAFIAGVTLASYPVALLISEKLTSLREFFLILFFFSIGAKFDFLVTQQVLLPGIVIAAVLLVIKPLVFRTSFRLTKVPGYISSELGIRLGQASEFSLLLAFAAINAGKIEPQSSFLIQLVVILTFVASTYLIVFKYPTPISNKFAVEPVTMLSDE